jgi:carboxylesterase type B
LGGLGACHCLDIPFVFDVLDAHGVAPVLGDDPPQSIADEIHAAFTRFARDGDAGWPVYDAATRSVLTLDETTAVVEDAWALQRELFTDEI